MRNLLFAAALCAVSCAEQSGPSTAPDEDEDPIVWPLPSDDVPPDLPTTARSLNDDPADPNHDVCGLLPNDDGACAHACDPDALLAFIPEGTCVVFSCTLTNGSLYRTGGCNK
jgi:hypothetical protein